MADLYFVPHEEEVYVVGRKQGDGFETDDGTVIKCKAGTAEEISDKEVLTGVNDCCALANVTAASILHTTRVRYLRGDIYTNVSNVLIAVNPFKALNIYSTTHLQRYKKSKDIAAEPPHVFGLCAGAFKCINESDSASSQAVLISGESGAGKTETTKLVLYFVSDMLAGQEGGIEDTLMEINPLVEAFGNAKTVRNDNSSRFGKWIEVMMEPASRSLTGVTIVDYLLEVTRVCGQAKGERNYHIFYQLSADLGCAEKYKLQDAANFNMLKTNPMGIKGVDDRAEFNNLRKALSTLNFSSDEEQAIFRSTAAVLHIGQVQFKGQEAEIKNPESVAFAAELLGVSKEALGKAMRFKRLKSMNEVIMSPLDENKAAQARDSIAKLVYGQLFKWIIQRSNTALGESLQGLGGGDASLSKFIGVLDIAGFESFEKNLLEQLLINLSNEKMQNFFNNIVFTRELQEYKAEAIDISKIDFKDNSDVLALIEGPGGILPFLDDATHGVKQTDETFTANICKEKASNPNFLKPKKFSPTLFGVRHYAGEVWYDASGFLEKNNSSKPDEVVELLQASTFQVVKEYATTGEEPEAAAASGPPRGGKSKKKATVGLNYRKSLQLLVEKLKDAQCHFVRCIKPNKQKVPEVFTSTMVMDQLRLCGVLETVEIRKAGFVVRFPYAEFVARFKIVAKKEKRKLWKPDDPKTSAKDILEVADSSQWALGKTKVFMKQAAFTLVEETKNKAVEPLVVFLQALRRGGVTRAHTKEAKALRVEILKMSKALGHDLLVKETMAKKIERATAQEDEARKFDILLQRAMNLPVKLAYLQTAGQAREAMRKEAQCARKLKDATGVSTNVVEIEKMLAEAKDYKIEGSIVSNAEKYLEDLKVDIAVRRDLQRALDSEDLDTINKALQEWKFKGIDSPDALRTPDAKQLFAKVAAQQMALQKEFEKQQAEAKALAKDVEALLNSTDLAAIHQVLNRAKAASLASPSVDKLQQRASVLAKEEELIKALERAMASDDADLLAEAVQKAEGHVGKGSWTIPNGEAVLKMAKTGGNKRNASELSAEAAQLMSRMPAALSSETDLSVLLDLASKLEQVALTQEAAEKFDKLNVRIARLKEENAFEEDLKKAAESFTKPQQFADMFAKWSKRPKWVANDPDDFVRKNVWELFGDIKEKHRLLEEGQVHLKKLQEAAQKMDIEELEERMNKCVAAGVPTSEFSDIAKLHQQLNDPEQLQKLIKENDKNPAKLKNLQAQAQILSAGDGDPTKQILTQLNRLVASKTKALDALRMVLKKADAQGKAVTDDPAYKTVLQTYENVARQEPHVKKLRKAYWSRDKDEIHKALKDFKQSEGGVIDRDAFLADNLESVFRNTIKTLAEIEEASTNQAAQDEKFLDRLANIKDTADIMELRAAIEEADNRKIGGNIIDEIRVRLKESDRQREYLRLIRRCIFGADDDGTAEDLLGALRKEGLDQPSKWQVADGPKTFESLVNHCKELDARYKAEKGQREEIMKQLQALQDSTDVEKLQAALTNASAKKVKGKIVDDLHARVRKLQTQRQYLKDLKNCLSLTDAGDIEEIFSRVRKVGLTNPSAWVWPEGQKILSKAVKHKMFYAKVEELGQTIKAAALVYDVRKLEQSFDEAERLGIPNDQFVKPYKLMLNLQSADGVKRYLGELKSEHDKNDGKCSDRVAQGIKNLVQQQKALGVKMGQNPLGSVTETLLRNGGLSGDMELLGVFGDLANLKSLKNPFQWQESGVAATTLEAQTAAMISFQSDKITASLTVMSSRLEEVAVQNFLDLLRCMGDKPSGYSGNKEDPILNRLGTSRKMADEIYVQVMKQLTNNPSIQSSNKGWALLQRMIREALPSAEVLEFLKAFLVQKANPDKEIADSSSKDLRSRMLRHFRNGAFKTKRFASVGDVVHAVVMKKREENKERLAKEKEDRKKKAQLEVTQAQGKKSTNRRSSIAAKVEASQVDIETRRASFVREQARVAEQVLSALKPARIG